MNSANLVGTGLLPDPARYANSVPVAIAPASPCERSAPGFATPRRALGDSAGRQVGDNRRIENGARQRAQRLNTLEVLSPTCRPDEPDSPDLTDPQPTSPASFNITQLRVMTVQVGAVLGFLVIRRAGSTPGASTLSDVDSLGVMCSVRSAYVELAARSFPPVRSSEFGLPSSSRSPPGRAGGAARDEVLSRSGLNGPSGSGVSSGAGKGHTGAAVGRT